MTVTLCVEDGCTAIAKARGRCNAHYHVERRARLAAEAAVGPLGDMEVPPPPGDWVELAACRGSRTSQWFPARGESLRPLREICDACPVCADCGAYALDHGIKHGVWGGLSERERRLIRREIRGDD